MGKAKDIIDEKKLRSWKLLDDFRRRLAEVRAATPKQEKRPGGPERKLLEEDRCGKVRHLTAPYRSEAGS